MGDVFLDSVQGLKELKLFRADARRQAYMNENAEEFRKITMKVLVMQLASVTIMDLVAFGGASIGAALAVLILPGAGGGRNIRVLRPALPGYFPAFPRGGATPSACRAADPAGPSQAQLESGGSMPGHLRALLLV